MTDRPLSCPDYLDLLDDYRRHTLPPEKSAAVAAHLQQCEQCRAELQTRDGLAAGLRAAFAEHDAPRAIPPGVMAALKEHRETNDPVAPQRPSPLLPWMLIAAVLLIAAVGLVQFKGADLTRQQTIAMQAEPASAPAPVATERTFARSALEDIKDASSDKAVAAPPAPAPPSPAADAAPGQLALKAELPMAAATQSTGNIAEEKRLSPAGAPSEPEDHNLRFYTQSSADSALAGQQAKVASDANLQVYKQEGQPPASASPAKYKRFQAEGSTRKLAYSGATVLSTSDFLLTDTLTSATATSATLTSATVTTGSLP